MLKIKFDRVMKKVFMIVLFVCFIFLSLTLFKFVNVCRNISSAFNCDTVVNTILIDSIEYNIIKRDTIIYNIKKIQKDEIEKANTITDSAAVELFKRLVSE